MFSLDGKTFIAKVVDVYDGDTCSVVVWYRGRLTKFRVRCSGYDSPEMKPPKNAENREEIIHRAMLARNFFAHRVTNCDFDIEGKYNKTDMQKIMEMNTKFIRIECGGWDKYGRLLADFYVDRCHVNTDMIARNHGYPYAEDDEDENEKDNDEDDDASEESEESVEM